MESRKKRVELLEGPQERGAPIVIVERGESDQEAWERHLAEHPEDKNAETIILIKGGDQDAPAPKGDTKNSPAAPGPPSRPIIR